MCSEVGLGEPDGMSQTTAPTTSLPRSPRRSATDRKLIGVCGGFAERYGLDPLVVRIAVAVLALFGGLGIVLYLAGAAWLAEPDDSSEITSSRRLPWLVVAVLAALILLPSLVFPFGDGAGFLVVAGLLALLVVLLRRPASPQPASPIPPDAQPVPQPTTASHAGQSFSPAAQSQAAPSAEPIQESLHPGAHSTVPLAETDPAAGDSDDGDTDPSETGPDQTGPSETGPDQTNADPDQAFPPHLTPAAIEADLAATDSLFAITHAPGDAQADETGVDESGYPDPTYPDPTYPDAGYAGAAAPPPYGYPPVAPAPPPRPAKVRSYLGGLTLSVALIWFGLAWALNAADVTSMTAVTIFGVTLAILAVGIVIGAWFGRARWLVLLALPLSLMLWGISAVPDSVRLGEAFDWVDDGIGEVDFQPGSGDGSSFTWGLGAAALDVADWDPQAQPHQVEADLGVGELVVRVPSTWDVEVVANVGLGSIYSAGESVEEGADLAQVLSFEAEADDAPQMQIDAEVGLGQIRIVTADQPALTR